MKKLRVLSYNIHKGFTMNNRAYVLEEIREGIRKTDADLVFLQEVVGVRDDIASAQFEFLADSVWSHYAYGKNAVTNRGHHGNAILSKYPIVEHRNFDVSTNRMEQRGVLEAKIDIPGLGVPLRVFCTHMSLFEAARERQAQWICERVRASSRDHEPVLLCGDFNDWRTRASDTLAYGSNLTELFEKMHGTPARTFPGWFPLLRLDRIYFRGLWPERAERLSGDPWNKLSDHLALFGEFGLPE